MDDSHKKVYLDKSYFITVVKVRYYSWSRDGFQFNQTNAGRNEEEGLSNEELMKYLQWMACNRPEKYGKLMIVFAKFKDMMWIKWGGEKSREKKWN